MTQDQARRINQAIAECDRFIAKEGQRNPALRPASELQHLEFCKTHKAKLQAMLVSA